MRIDVDDVIASVAGEDPTKLGHRDLIRQQLATVDHTPDHPVYSVMIREALTELSEEKGSTSEAISQFIARKYDVLPVIHPAKLIEQLEKLIKKKEIAVTPDGCYILPLGSSGSHAKLKSRKRRLGRVQQDCKHNALCKVNGGCETQEDLDTTKEVQEQFQTAFEVAGFANEDNIVTAHIEVTKEKTKVVMNIPVEEGSISEGSHIEELDGPPGFCTKSLVKQNYLREEIEDELQGKQDRISEEQFSQLEGELLKVAEEEALEQNGKRVEDQRQVGEIQAVLKEIVGSGEETKMQGHGPKVMEHQAEVVAEVNGGTQNLNVQGCSHPGKTCDETIEMQNEPQGQEVEFNEEQKRQRRQQKEDGNHSTSISCMPDVSLHVPEEDRPMAMASSSSQASGKFIHAEPIPSFCRLKEMYIDLLKKTKDIEQVLMDNIKYFNLVEASNFGNSQPMVGEIVMLPQSEPKEVSDCDFVHTDKVQHFQNQRIEVPCLKRTRELDITAPDEFILEQRKLAKTCNVEREPNFGLGLVGKSSVMPYSKQLGMEHRQDHSNVGGHERHCARQTSFESCLTLTSSDVALEQPKLDLVHQPTHVEHFWQEQQLGLAKLGGVLERNGSVVEQELMAGADVCMVTHQLEHIKLLECQRSETDPSAYTQSLIEERPTGIKKMDEQPPLEQLKAVQQSEISVEHAIQACELAVPEQLPQECTEQIIFIAKGEEHQCEPKRGPQQEILLREEPAAIDMTTVEKQCLTQSQELGPHGQMTSTVVSGTAICTPDHHLEHTEVPREENPMIMAEASQPLMEQAKGSNPGMQTKGKCPRRQLRPQKAKQCEFDQAHVKVANDLDMALSIPKTQRKMKRDPPDSEKDQRRRTKRAGHLSQLLEEVNHVCQHDQLKSQFVKIASSGEVQTQENLGQIKPKRSGDLVQTWQQLQRQQRQLQSPLSKPEKCSLEDMKEQLPSENEKVQQVELRDQSQTRPADLSCEGCGMALIGVETPPKDNNTSPDLFGKESRPDHENQYGKRQGRLPKLVPSSDKKIKLLLPTQHQSHKNEHQSPEQCGERPKMSKSTSAMASTWVLSLPSQQQPKKTVEGRITSTILGVETPPKDNTSLVLTGKESRPDHENQYGEHRGSPPRLAPSSDKKVKLLSPTQHQSIEQPEESPKKSKSTLAMGSTWVLSLPSQQQPKKTVEGRMARSRADANEAVTMSPLPSRHLRRHGTPQCPEKKKPSKSEIDSDASMEILQTPQHDQQLPKRFSRRRHRKTE